MGKVLEALAELFLAFLQALGVEISKKVLGDWFAIIFIAGFLCLVLVPLFVMPLSYFFSKEDEIDPPWLQRLTVVFSIIAVICSFLLVYWLWYIDSH